MPTPTPKPSIKTGSQNFQGTGIIYNFLVGNKVADDLGAYLADLEGKVGLAPVYYLTGTSAVPGPAAAFFDVAKALAAVQADGGNGNMILNFGVYVLQSGNINLGNAFIQGNQSTLSGNGVLTATAPQFNDVQMSWGGFRLTTGRKLRNCTMFGDLFLTKDSEKPVLTLDNTAWNGNVTGAGTINLVNGATITGTVGANVKVVVTVTKGVYRGVFVANTTFNQNDTITAADGATLLAAKVDFTSAGSFNAANWAVAAGNGQAAVRSALSSPGTFVTYDQTTGVIGQAFVPENPANRAADLAAPSDRTYPSTKAASDAIAAAEARAKAYAEQSGGSATNYAGGYSAAGNPGYPTAGTGTGGGIRRGDRYTVTGANADGSSTVGGVKVENGDELVAQQATPGQTAANWNFLQANVFQATDNSMGTARLAPVADAVDEATANDTDIVTPFRLWKGLGRLLAKANTWAKKQTFTEAPHFTSATPNTFLRVNATGDLVSATAADLAAVAGAAATVVAVANQATYTVTHGKGRLVNVQLYDASNDLFSAPVHHADDLNSFLVSLDAATTFSIVYL